MFGRLTDWRRLALRFERCAHTVVSAIGIAATGILGLSFTRPDPRTCSRQVHQREARLLERASAADGKKASRQIDANQPLLAAPIATSRQRGGRIETAQIAAYTRMQSREMLIAAFDNWTSRGSNALINRNAREANT